MFRGCLGSNLREHIEGRDVTAHEQVLRVQVFAYAFRVDRNLGLPSAQFGFRGLGVSGLRVTRI